MPILVTNYDTLQQTNQPSILVANMVAISKILTVIATATALPVATAIPIGANQPALTDNNTNINAALLADTLLNQPAKRDDDDSSIQYWDSWPEDERAIALAAFVDQFNVHLSRPGVGVDYTLTVEEMAFFCTLPEMQQFLKKEDWHTFYEWSTDGANFYTFMNAVECKIDKAGLITLPEHEFGCDEFCEQYKSC